jgi:hypothetical protein
VTPDTIYNNAIKMRDCAIDTRWKIMGLFFLVQAGGFSLISALLKEMPFLLVGASALYGVTLTPHWINLIGTNEAVIAFLTARLHAIETAEKQATPLFGQEFSDTLLTGPRIHNILFNLIVIFSFVWFVVANAALLRLAFSK